MPCPDQPDASTDAGSGEEPTPVPVETASPDPTRPFGNCEEQSVFLHFAGTPPDESFRQQLETALGLEVKASLPKRVGGCYGARICPRHDGHRRFFEIFKPGGFARGEACQTINNVRAAAASISGLPSERIRVGLERCNVALLDAQRRFGQAYANPTVPPNQRVPQLQSTWHRRDIGLQAPIPEPQVARVALVDALVQNVTCDYEHLGRQTRLTIGTAPNSPTFDLFSPVALAHGPNEHGAAMAALIHSISPRTPLDSFPAIDDLGFGRVVHVAQSLDAALFDEETPSLRDALKCRGASGRHAELCSRISTRARAPLLINMSLGMPPEADLKRRFDDGPCNTTEDGPGWILEYLLRLARDLDSPTTPILVTVAAGNFGTGRGRPGIDDTAPGAFFVPAQLSNDDGPLALVAGEVGPMGLQGTFTRWDREPLLVAPGELVYPDPEYPSDELTVSLPGGASAHPDNPCSWPTRPPLLQCGGASDTSNRYLLPSAYSGTSVSAALTTGAAAAGYAKFHARLLAAIEAARVFPAGSDPSGFIGPRVASDGFTSISGKWMARALYAAGAPTGRSTAGAPVRELCIAKLDQLMQNYSTLRGCIEAPSRALLPNGLVGCVQNRVAGFAAAACPGATRPAAWAEAAVDESAYFPPGANAPCKKLEGSTPAADRTASALTSRSTNIAASWSGTGTGPQPGETSCPLCALVVKNAGPPSEITLLLHFNPDLPGTMSKPALVVVQGGKLYETDLAEAFEAADPNWESSFVPGASFELDKLAMHPEVDVNEAFKAVLVVEITGEDGKASDDYAPLKVDQ